MGFSWCLGVLGLLILVSTANSVHAMTRRIDALQTTLACFSAVANVNAAACITQSRRDLCKCFEKNAPAYGVKPEKAQQLPGLCAVHVAVPIDPSVD